MDPLLDPQMAEWLRQKQEALGQAYEADKAAQTDADRRALLMQFAQSYAAGRPSPVQPRQVNDARSRFAAETGLEDKARSYGLDALKAYASMQGKNDPDKEPAPPEWKAPVGMSKEQAIRAGYAKNPAAMDTNDLPIDEPLADSLRKLGVDPALARNRGEGYRLLSYAAQRSAQEAANADRDASRAISSSTAEVAREASRARSEDRQRENESKAAMGPDFEPLTNQSPLYADETSKRNLLETATASRKMARAVGVVRDIVQKYGTDPVSLPAEARSRIDSAIADIRTQIKTIDKLGVIAGPDMPAFISPQIDNPTTFKNHFLRVLQIRDPLAQLDQLERNMAGGVAEAAEGYGVSLSPGSFFRKYARQPAGGGAKRPRRTVGNETREWDGTKWVPVGG